MPTQSKTKPKPVKKVKPVKSAMRLAYDKLNADQKHSFLNTVCEKTGRAERTVYGWIRDFSHPTVLEKQVIANALGLPLKKLFK